MAGLLKKLKGEKKVTEKTKDAKDGASNDVVVAKSIGKKSKNISKKMDSEAYRCLLKPLITEKATELGAKNQYLFIVPTSANKAQIATKIEHVYGVKPVKVQTANFAGKKVRYGRSQGRKKSWKKAIVVLSAGDKIEIYEGV
ncbi:MAG TPA: 50S ribosomal protein L23 [Candidatus Bipolaricaulota bacterium]|nr:50S ribosomal protein L23 [Candidatus Bipolaricaulota bacterium]